MKRKMHAKTVALVLATTTALQATGIASQLLNGVPFEVANAAVRDTANYSDNVVVTTTGAAVEAAKITASALGQIKVGDSVLNKAKGLVASGYDVSVKTADGIFIDTSGEAITTGAGVVVFTVQNRTNSTDKAETASLNITVELAQQQTTGAAVTGVSVVTAPTKITYKVGDTLDLTGLVVKLTKADETTEDVPFADFESKLITTDPENGEKLKISSKLVTIKVNNVTTSQAITVTETTVVNKKDLETGIDSANKIYDAAVEGTAEGQYKAGSKDTFKQAIDAAQAVVENKNATQKEVDDAIDVLKIATAKFKDSQITSPGSQQVNKDVLEDNIADAQGIYDEAVEGTEVGQYKAGSKAIFKKAIDKAQAVVNKSNATQDEVDAQVNALAIAVDTFKESRIPEDSNNSEVEMPSAVIIKGTERVGKTLTAQLLKVDPVTGKISNFTTSAGVTYEWYRLDDKNDDITEGKAVGHDDDYKLTSSDKGKYIKLIVTYNGKHIGDDITSKIAKKASSGGSSSSSSDDDDDDNDNGSSNDNNNGNNGNDNSNGNAATSTASIETKADGTVKLVDKNGQPATGWQLVNGTWYLGDATGTPLTGWQLVNGTWYLMDTTGVMQTGWQLVGGKWYLLNNSGSMATGWQSVNGKWYLLNGDGSMATGWQKSNGKWYYLYSDGSMASNTVIDGYTVNASGAWV